MLQTVRVPIISSFSVYCEKCRGRHWHKDDNLETQQSAKAEFGIIPNNCVNGNGGVVNCPYALGILH